MAVKNASDLSVARGLENGAYKFVRYGQVLVSTKCGSGSARTSNIESRYANKRVCSIFNLGVVTSENLNYSY